MARTKKQTRAKEPLKLRFKDLSNGNKSLYLDFYRDGKRTYEFLKLYLVPEKDQSAKVQNQNTLKVANAIKAQRILEISDEKAGLTNNSKGKMLVSDWLSIYQQKQTRKGFKNSVSMKQLDSVLRKFKGDKLKLKQIDTDFCKSFLDYLKNTYRTAKGKPLKLVTVLNYYRTLACVLNEAVRAGVILENPLAKLDRTDKIKAPESPREFLTIDEVKKLIETPCKYPMIKQSYLFSVFCGLRISDISVLTWKQIIIEADKCHIELVMKKTKAPLYLPLSDEARKWLPERNGKPDDSRVFVLPKQQRTLSTNLKKWAQKAGISKKVTFHTARHTFATMMLTLGCDLYTTSKLLGHADISTTQIYAKIIDKKKVDAVNLVNGIF